MKVFLSWSGNTSHKIALRLYDWLPMVIQKLEPYISSDIEKGTRWATDIANELQACSFGIACVTAENRDAPWLLFEAGALSKSVEEGRLSPVLFGVDQSGIQKSPLSQFQMTKFERGEFLKLLTTMNELLGDSRLEGKVLEGIFSALWPALETEIAGILEETKEGNDYPVASSPEKLMGIVEELLATTRAIAQTVNSPEKILPEAYVAQLVGRQESSPSRISEKAITGLISRGINCHGLLTSLSVHSKEKETKAVIHECIALIEKIVDEAMSIRRVRTIGRATLPDRDDGPDYSKAVDNE